MTGSLAPLNQLPMLADGPWQMSNGERAALEGVLAQLRPRLALEIGTAEGGSLARVAAWSGEVHSFDLVPPPPNESVSRLENVTWHTGDSHALLPRVLAELAAGGREVDFVLVDGDHSAVGVRQDIEDILSSDVVRHTLIMLHDTMNDAVREGVTAVDYGRYPKVALIDLDFMPGYLARGEPYRLQFWGGLGLLVVDESRSEELNGPVRDDRFHELVALLRPARDLMREIESDGVALDSADPTRVEQLLRERWRPSPEEQAGLRADLARAERRVRDIEASLSWRATAPLRSLKHRVAGVRQTRSSR